MTLSPLPSVLTVTNLVVNKDPTPPPKNRSIFQSSVGFFWINFPLVLKEPFAGDSEHNRATWQSRRPAEIHLNAFRKQLYVCPACNQRRREEKGPKGKKESVKCKSFLATCSSRWNLEFCRTLWICFSPIHSVVLSPHWTQFWFIRCTPPFFLLVSIILCTLHPTTHTFLPQWISNSSICMCCFFSHCNLSLCASDLLKVKPHSSLILPSHEKKKKKAKTKAWMHN